MSQLNSTTESPDIGFLSSDFVELFEHLARHKAYASGDLQPLISILNLDIASHFYQKWKGDNTRQTGLCIRHMVT